MGDGNRLPPNPYHAHFHPRLKCSSKEGKERSDGEEEGVTGVIGRKVEKVRTRVGNREIRKRKWAEKKRES